jgi:hypothetical protein
MALFDDASLVVTPNGYKEGTLYSIKPTSGAGDMTVVRATTATRVNSAGLIELVPYNLFGYSEEFNNAYWQKISSTVTPNTTIAPNGTLTADTLVVSSSGYLYKQINYSASLGNSITMSIYTKNSDANFLYFAGSTIAGTDVSTIVNVGDGWYRHIVTRTFTTSATGIIQFLLGYFLPGTYYIWGAQLNDGTIKDYLRTETRLNIPRLDYSNGSCPSLLVEPQRTNLVTYSEQLDNAAWTKSGVTVTANTTISPDGTQNADTVTNITTSDFISQIIGAPTATAYAASFYIKNEDSTTTSILVRNAVNSLGGSINWNGSELVSITGVVNGTLTFESVGNDWYRIFGNFTSVETVQRVRISPDSTASGKSVYVWGYQLEQGASYATSYIPTTTASVTRNADVISKTGISSLIGQTEGTIFVDYVLNGQTNDANILNSEKNTTCSLFMAQKTNGNFDAGLYASAVLKARITAGSIAVNQRAKVAYAYKSGNSALYINGVQVGTSADTYTLPSTLDDIFLNDITTYFSYQENVSYNQATLFQTRLTNAELASLTTI